MKSIKKGVKSVKGFILNTLFPRQCIFCKKIFDTYLCDQCFLDIKIINQCENKVGDLDTLSIVCEYGPVLEELIHTLKYKYILDIKSVFGKIIHRSNFDFSKGILIPIPLHRKRHIERGFNQSEILAKYFNGTIDSTLILRKKNTKQLALLNRVERFGEIKEVFILNKKRQNIPNSVILVDDVYTTGATMQESAKYLKSIGVESVSGVVLARREL